MQKWVIADLELGKSMSSQERRFILLCSKKFLKICSHMNAGCGMPLDVINCSGAFEDSLVTLLIKIIPCTQIMIIVFVWHNAVQIFPDASKMYSTTFMFLTSKCMCISMFLNNYSGNNYPPTLFHLPYFTGHLFWNPALAEYKIHSGNRGQQFTSWNKFIHLNTSQTNPGIRSTKQDKGLSNRILCTAFAFFKYHLLQRDSWQP